MRLSNYVKIGRAPLINLIGLQPNYKKTVQVLDTKASGCGECPYAPLSGFFLPFDSICNRCSRAVTSEKTIYVNERNIYSRNNPYSDTHLLKAGAIRLYILLHFCEINTEYGITDKFKVADLAELLSCHRKTIKHNLNILEEHGYIRILPAEDEFISVRIENYSQNFQKAERGGRGYIVFSQELLKEVLSHKQTNELRLCLRLVNETTLNQEKSGVHKARTKLTYEDLRRYLPFYVKPHIIRQIMTNLTSLFDNVNTGRAAMTVTLAPAFLASKAYTVEKRHNFLEITDFINKLRKEIDAFNQSPTDNVDGIQRIGIRIPGIHIDDDLEIKHDALQNFFLSNTDRNDMASLAIEYSIDEVKAALLVVYNEYVQPRTQIKTSLGGLVRRIIQNEREFFELA